MLQNALKPLSVWCPLTLMMVRSAASPFTLLELTKIVAISAAILFQPCLSSLFVEQNYLNRYTSFITLRKTILFLMSAWSGLTWFVVPLALSQPPLIFQPSDGRCGPGNEHCFLLDSTLPCLIRYTATNNLSG